MLTIRDAQMDALAEQRWSAYLREAVEPLREALAERFESVPVDAQRRRVAWALARGRAFGLQRCDALESFAELLLTFGPVFEAHPAVARLLNASGVLPETRLERLLSGLPSSAWAELESLRRGADWRAVDLGTGGP